MRDHLDFRLELKDVSASQRIIEGYASTADLDAGGDIVEVGAVKIADPTKVQVYVGHDHQTGALPVGVPLEIRQDARGLFTKTRIHKTARGDELLEVARSQPLGLSIGYPPSSVKAKYESKSGRMIRRIQSLDLVEYSFTAIPMNDHAVVTAVKSRSGGTRWLDEIDEFLVEQHLAEMEADLARLSRRVVLTALPH